jgi:hypothetical protein
MWMRCRFRRELLWAGGGQARAGSVRIKMGGLRSLLRARFQASGKNKSSRTEQSMAMECAF